MKKRWLAATLAGVMAAGLLAGCGSSDNSSSSKSDSSAGNESAGESEVEACTIRVALWDYSNTEYFKTIFDKFNEVYPEIEIEPVEFPADEYTNTVTTQLGGKADFDVVFSKGIPELSGLIGQGHIAVLDDYISSDTAFDAANYNGLIDQLSLDGNTYGIPFRYDNNLIFYNKDLFDAANVEYPQDGMTMAEYHELAEKMTSGEGNDKVYGAHVHTWTTNVTEFVRRTEIYNPIDPETYDTLKDYYNEILAMQDEGIVQDYGALKSSNLHYSGVFYNQQAAMLEIGTWYINMLCENVEDFNWGVCALPNNEGLGAETAVGGVTPVSIGAYAKHPEAAWKFVQFVTSEEAAKVLAECGIVPGYASDAIGGIFDAIPETYPNAPEGLSKYITGVTNSLVEVPMDANSKEIGSILDEMHSAIMTESVSVDEGIQNAYDRVQEVLAQ